MTNDELIKLIKDYVASQDGLTLHPSGTGFELRKKSKVHGGFEIKDNALHAYRYGDSGVVKKIFETRKETIDWILNG